MPTACFLARPLEMAPAWTSVALGIFWDIKATSSPFVPKCHCLAPQILRSVACQGLADTNLTKPGPQAEQSKVLSAVEDRMDELSASIAQSRRTVALIKVRAHSNPRAPLKQASEITHELSLCYHFLDVPRLRLAPTQHEHLVSCYLAQIQSRLGLVLCPPSEAGWGLGGHKQSWMETAGRPGLCLHCCLHCPPAERSCVRA